MKKVTIYTTPTCGYCTMAKEWFKEKKIEFSEIDVVKDPAKGEEMVKISGQMGVPVIVVGEGKDQGVVVGFDQAKLEDLLE